MIIDETEKLIIKEIDAEDYGRAAFFFSVINTKNVTISERAVYDEKFVEHYCEAAYGFYGYGYYGLYLKSGEFIGIAGFREGSCPLDIGFIVDEKYRGRGYATDAVKSLTEWAYEDFLWVVNEEEKVTPDEVARRHPEMFTYVKKCNGAVLLYAVTGKENYSAQKVLLHNDYELIEL